MKARLVNPPGMTDGEWAAMMDARRLQRRVEAWLASGAAQRLSSSDLVINAALQLALDPADVAEVLRRDRR